MDLKSGDYKRQWILERNLPVVSINPPPSLCLCDTISVLMDYTALRRPCFVEEDDGLASFADLEAGFSGSHGHNHHAFFSRSLCLSSSFSRRASFRNISLSSPRSVRSYDARFEEHRPYFLEACFLCKKTLGGNRDIFMYRGDTPFCSEECRHEQIEVDEAKEKKLSLSSMKAIRNNDQRQSSSPSKTSARGFNFITSTVAAA